MAKAAVLLVDNDSTVRDIVRKTIDTARWDILEQSDAEAAFREAEQHPPDLVILNADLPKGWQICTKLKRRFQRVPLVLLSSRANQEIFNNHQALETRADAYHKLPEDLDRLEITLSYYANHTIDDDDDDDLTEALHRARKEIKALRTRLKQVSDLEAASAHARDELKGTLARIQSGAEAGAANEITALAAERDRLAARAETMERQREDLQEELETARAEAARAQADATGAQRELTELRGALDKAQQELLSVGGRHAGLEGELAAAREELRVSEARIAELEALYAHAAGDAAAALEASRAASSKALEEARTELGRRTKELSNLKETLSTLKGQLASAQGAESAAADGLAAMARERDEARHEAVTQKARAEALEDEFAASRTLRDQLRAELQAAQETIAAARAAEAAANERADTVERAWAGVNARVERQQSALRAKKDDFERLEADKAELESALATSRKLMKEYGQEVARRKEEQQALEVALEAARAEARAAQQEAESLAGEIALRAGLEGSIKTLAEQANAHSAKLEAVIAALRSRIDHLDGRLTAEESLTRQMVDLAKAIAAAPDKLAHEDALPPLPEAPERPSFQPPAPPAKKG